VQNAMTGPDTSLIGGVIAASTLLLVNYVVGRFSSTSRGFRRVVQGEPSLLVHDGKAIESHMAKEHVSYGRTGARPARARHHERT
jgi:uncharacterized membrane protein YcaP (DUF421 family)